MKSCGITGRRPKALPWGYDESDIRANRFKNRLKYSLSELVEKGYTEFNIGMAQGIDTYICEILLSFRDDGTYESIIINAIVPSHDFAKHWKRDDRIRYERLIFMADNVKYISESYTPHSTHLRNMEIVDNSDILYAVYDNIPSGGTYNTIEYARKKGIDVIVELIE